MKRLLLVVCLFVTPALADMPEYLKDGTVTVTLANGETHTFSSNDYKVVPRVQVSAETLAEAEAAPSTDELKASSLPSRTVILHAGVGQDGLSVSNSNNQFKVSERDAIVGGATLCQRTDSSMAVCASGFTNRTFTLGVGFDF
jgi:hypothetical protein